MREYFVGIISVVFLGGMIVTIMPSGATQKYLRLLCGLSVMACMVMPVFSLFTERNTGIDNWDALNGFDSGDELEYVEIYNNSLKNAVADNAENALKNDIIREFSARYDDIDVEIEVSASSDEIYILSVWLKIHPSGVLLDPHEIKKYLEDRLQCPCTVVYL